MLSTPFFVLKKDLETELKKLGETLAEDDINLLVTRAIEDYSADDPLLKEKAITVDANGKAILPDDFMQPYEVRSSTGVLLPKQFTIDWTRGLASEVGSYTVHSRAFLRFADVTSSTLTLFYWGFHKGDGSTLKSRDIPRILLLLYSRAYSLLATNEAKKSGGRVQAGPVSFDRGETIKTLSVKAVQYQNEYERRYAKRPYGRHGQGRSFNTRELAVTTSGETLG